VDVWINPKRRMMRGTSWLYRGDRVVDVVAMRRVRSIKRSCKPVNGKAESGLSSCVAGGSSDAVIGERSEKKRRCERKLHENSRGVGGRWGGGGIYCRKS
jgi:hypothetical protein